jgi:hypothetical protein
MTVRSRSLLVVAALVLVPVRVHQQGAFRALTIDTTEVTTPAIRIWREGGRGGSAAIGNLSELLAVGGTATQLKFGPS